MRRFRLAIPDIGWPRFFGAKWPAALIGIGALATAGLAIWLASVPLPQIAPAAQSSEILAADGQLIATLHGEENRTLVPLDKISSFLKAAVIASEDRTFFEHRGFSLRGTIRAAKANWTGGRILQGGSTITQQYVRQAFPSVGKERTLGRKIREAFWAVQLERHSTKQEILERYLNTVYFGRGAYGAEAAARTYFKVSAADLTPGEAAYLAGVMPSPQRFQIDADPAQATSIRNIVLDKMVAMGTLTPTAAAAAKTENLAGQFKPGLSIEIESARAGYFVEYVRRLLRSEFQLSDEEVLRGGLTIRTTLDLKMQDAAENAVKTVLNRANDPEAALVAMDPEGRVKAMVGGRDVDNPDRSRGFNFAADVSGTGGGRPAGSAFKPIALAAFVEDGKSVQSTFSGSSPKTISSEKCRNADGTPWRVSNYGGSGYGYLDVVSATTNSVNTIYAQMMDEVVTPAKFMDVAHRLGIEIPGHDAGCALTLGTTDVTPLEMAAAYTTFGQRGRHPTPMAVSKITKPNGEVVAERFPATSQVMDANIADTVNYVLEKNVQSGTGTGAKLSRPAAGKTGTTDNFQDAWFAGYTPDLTAVVWMGFPPGTDGKIPLMSKVRGKSVTGGSFPATIWKTFMVRAVQGSVPSSFVTPKLTGQVITHRPPVQEYFPWPVIEFPPCFPFCDNSQGGSIQLDDGNRDRDRAARQQQVDDLLNGMLNRN